jgi:rubrerythrin
VSGWVRRTEARISSQLATYRREFAGGAAARATGDVTCPRCGLVRTGRPANAEPWHCPRCLARERAVVELVELPDGASAS